VEGLEPMEKSQRTARLQSFEICDDDLDNYPPVKKFWDGV